jgi:hypothetical protein
MKNPIFKQFSFARILVIVFLAGCAAPTATQGPVISTSIIMPSAMSTQTLLPTATIDLVQAQKSATLYEQDFESDSIDGIVEKGGKWSIVTDTGSNHIYCNDVSDNWQSFKFGLETWTNYAIQMRVKILALNANQSAEVYTRVNSETTGYRANMDGSGARLGYYLPNKDLGETSFVTEANTWYTFRIEAAGNRIKFYINDQLIANAVDDQRLAGMAGFGAAPNTKACVDDIRVWALTQDGQIAQTPPVDQVVVNSPLSKYEGDCIFCFVDGSDPSMPVWNDKLQGYEPQSGDTREQIVLVENFSVPAGQTVTFENKIIFIKPHQRRDIQVYGTLVINNSLLIWEQTEHQQTELRIKNGGKLSIENSYSFSGNQFWVNWDFEDGSTIYFDHFVGDPWTSLWGTVNYTAVHFSTVHVTIFGNVKNTSFKVSDAHSLYLELYPPAGNYVMTLPARHQWADWTIPDVWPGTDISVTHSYIYESDMSIDNDVHVTIIDTPSGFGLGWSISKDTPGYVDCELKGLGDPEKDEGVFYEDATWDLPCNNSSLTIKNSLLLRAWPVTYGYIHLKVYNSNLVDPRNYSAPATYEIYDSTIDHLAAYAGGLIYVENSKIRYDVEVNGSNSIVYSYGITARDPGTNIAIMQESGGKYIELKSPGVPW